MIKDFSEIVKQKYPNNYDYYFNKGKNMISNILKLDYFDNINNMFIDNVLNSTNIKIIFYSHNNNFLIKNNIGISIYYIVKNNKETKFYLLLFGINKKYRGIGYGSEFLNIFINYCKSINCKLNKSIILHSIISSYNLSNLSLATGFLHLFLFVHCKVKHLCLSHLLSPIGEDFLIGVH